MLIAAASSLTLLVITANIAEGGGVGIDGGVGSVGINWGRQTSQKLLPSMVVDMCLANGIDKVRFYSVNDGVLSAFFNTNTQVTVTIPNNELENHINTTEKAKAWVVKNISYYCKQKGLDIRYINFGTEPFSAIEMKDGLTTYHKLLPQNYKDIQKALDEEGLGDKIKLAIPHGTDILKPFKKPSEADFRDDIEDIMIEILQHHHTYNSPLMMVPLNTLICLI